MGLEFNSEQGVSEGHCNGCLFMCVCTFQGFSEHYGYNTHNSFLLFDHSSSSLPQPSGCSSKTAVSILFLFTFELLTNVSLRVIPIGFGWIQSRSLQSSKDVQERPLEGQKETNAIMFTAKDKQTARCCCIYFH